MKTPNLSKITIPFVAAVLILGLSAGLNTGCETESADEAGLRISPAHAEISLGESITLKASGWHSYRWNLSNRDIGTLSATTGDTVVYTATGGSGETNVVTVEAIGGEAISAGSPGEDDDNQDASGLSGTARILHR